MNYPVTALTGEELKSFIDESERLLKLLEGTPSRPLARGLLGVALIQDCVRRTNGDPDWWSALVRTGQWPGGTFPRTETGDTKPADRPRCARCKEFLSAIRVEMRLDRCAKCDSARGKAHR